MTRAEAQAKLADDIRQCYKRSGGSGYNGSAYPDSNGNIQTPNMTIHDPLSCSNCNTYLAQFVVDMLHIAASERLTNGG